MTMHKTIRNYYKKNKCLYTAWVVGTFIRLGDSTSSQRDIFRGKRSAKIKIFSSSNILTL